VARIVRQRWPHLFREGAATSTTTIFYRLVYRPPPLARRPVSGQQ
jgi:hypothetical protein